MIKTLLSLTALGLAPVVPTALSVNNIVSQNSLNQSEINPQAILETWDHVNLQLQVTTPVSGTHTRSDQKSVSAISVNEWNSLKNVSDITLYGLFYFHTYKEPKTYTEIALRKDSSSTNKITFKFHDTHDKWAGWGHQTSEIAITVSINYDPNGSGKAIFAIDNYVLARTAGSVHECSTTSNVDKIEMKL